MKNTREEAGFFPISADKQKVREWDKIRLAYSSGKGRKTAHISRLFLFRKEAQGWDKLASVGHNRSRFRSPAVLLPNREREQIFQAEQKQKQEQKRLILLKLRYARRYGEITLELIEECKTAGIKLREDRNLSGLSNADLHRQFIQKFAFPK